MIIDYNKKIVFLANTKVASSSVEAALKQQPGIGFMGKHPRLKHINFRRYLSMQKGLHTVGFTTVCVVRHPFGKAISWYKYRSREKIRGTDKSTYGMSFEDYITLQIERKEEDTGPAALFDRKFVTAQHKIEKAVDIIFKYERIDEYWDYLRGLYGPSLEIPQANVSPKLKDESEFENERDRFCTHYAKHVEWYEALKSGDQRIKNA